jgi:hypothetical protein
MGKISKDEWLSRTWGKLCLDPEQELPEAWAKGSKENFRIICNCSSDHTRTFTPIFSNVGNGLVKSCGKCTWLTKEAWISQKWGSLHIVPTDNLPDEWGPYAEHEIQVSCDCGEHNLVRFSDMNKHGTTSCGKCNDKPKEYWLEKQYGDLKLVDTPHLPQSWSSGSGRCLLFSCICGREIDIPFGEVYRGHSKSCGKCLNKSKDYWLSQTWGELRVDPNQNLPSEWGRGLDQDVRMLCTCGNTHSTPFNAVTCGKVGSCGRCNHQSADYWLTKKWGTLGINPNQKLPDKWAPTTHQIFKFNCDCGQYLKTQFSSVVTGNTKSCGDCSKSHPSYWLSQRWGKLRLDPNQLLPDIFGSNPAKKLSFLCDCGGTIKTRLGNAVYGYTKSCGCIKPGTSQFSPAGEIYKFVKELAPDALFSKWIGRVEYDIYVPSKKLAIEYHGLVWHSEKFNPTNKDHKKFIWAQKRGDRLIQIYQDEWRDKQKIIKDQLRGILSPEKKTRIKPSFELMGRTSLEAKRFLDQHHYLGEASGCVTVVAKHGDKIVGVWVFQRRNKDTMLWHRACWDHTYKAWNPHEKALKLALPLLKEMGVTRMVTFSDNRFHTGELYEKFGFTFEKETPPNYSYTNFRGRVAKQSFRVRAGVNEKETAKAKGWYRIWDSGKRRYALFI